jgi:hypothetical protein
MRQRRANVAQQGWEVGFGFPFLTLLVTGYAPAVALTPMYGRRPRYRSW